MKKSKYWISRYLGWIPGLRIVFTLFLRFTGNSILKSLLKLWNCVDSTHKRECFIVFISKLKFFRHSKIYEPIDEFEFKILRIIFRPFVHVMTSLNHISPKRAQTSSNMVNLHTLESHQNESWVSDWLKINISYIFEIYFTRWYRMLLS